MDGRRRKKAVRRAFVEATQEGLRTEDGPRWARLLDELKETTLQQLWQAWQERDLALSWHMARRLAGPIGLKSRKYNDPERKCMTMQEGAAKFEKPGAEWGCLATVFQFAAGVELTVLFDDSPGLADSDSEDEQHGHGADGLRRMPQRSVLQAK